MILVVGAIFIVLGVSVRLGMWKAWFWKTRGGVYGYVPLGLLFILYAYNEPLLDMLGSSAYLFYVAFGLLFAAVLYLSLRPPAWVKPGWVKWIESQPAPAVKAMRAAVQAGDTWNEHIQSQETVAAWARQLTKKNSKSK